MKMEVLQVEDLKDLQRPCHRYATLQVIVCLLSVIVVCLQMKKLVGGVVWLVEVWWVCCLSYFFAVASNLEIEPITFLGLRDHSLATARHSLQERQNLQLVPFVWEDLHLPVRTCRLKTNKLIRDLAAVAALAADVERLLVSEMCLLVDSLVYHWTDGSKHTARHSLPVASL